MSSKTPEFTIKQRGDRLALYVNNYKIWDLTDRECTENVQNAIMHAYFLGVRDMRREINYIDIPGDLQCTFKKV